MTTLTAEILVIGAGPAGIAAAVKCRKAGRNVLVVDDNAAPGGQIWRGVEQHASTREFEGMQIPFLPSAQMIAADYKTRSVFVETSEWSFRIHFQRLIAATGARERFLPFPGWTLPGVTGVGGLQALVKSGVPIVNKTVVVAGSGPLLLAVGAGLRKAGARVTLIAEQAPMSVLRPFTFEVLRSPAKLAQAFTLRMRTLGVPYRFGCWVVAAEGKDRLESVTVRQDDRTWIEPCDYAAVAYGLLPNTEIAALLGCRMSDDGVWIGSDGRTSLPDVFCAGEATGIAGVEAAQSEGEIAARAACGQSIPHEFRSKSEAHRRFGAVLKQSFALRAELRGLPTAGTIVCRCEDVSYAELKHYSSFRAAKLHGRCGMGPCQARICGPAVEFLFGWKPDSVRPPLYPARLESLYESEETVTQ